MPQITQYRVSETSLVSFLQTVHYPFDLTPGDGEYQFIVLRPTKDPVTTTRQDELALVALGRTSYDISTIGTPGGNRRYTIASTTGC